MAKEKLIYKLTKENIQGKIPHLDFEIFFFSLNDAKERASYHNLSEIKWTEENGILSYNKNPGVLFKISKVYVK